MINSLISIILLAILNPYFLSAVFITVSYSNTSKLQLHVPFLSLIETHRKDEEDQHEEGDGHKQKPLWRRCQTQREQTH